MSWELEAPREIVGAELDEGYPITTAPEPSVRWLNYEASMGRLNGWLAGPVESRSWTGEHSVLPYLNYDAWHGIGHKSAGEEGNLPAMMLAFIILYGFLFLPLVYFFAPLLKVIPPGLWSNVVSALVALLPIVLAYGVYVAQGAWPSRSASNLFIFAALIVGLFAFVEDRSGSDSVAVVILIGTAFGLVVAALALTPSQKVRDNLRAFGLPGISLVLAVYLSLITMATVPTGVSWGVGSFLVTCTFAWSALAKQEVVARAEENERVAAHRRLVEQFIVSGAPVVEVPRVRHPSVVPRGRRRKLLKSENGNN